MEEPRALGARLKRHRRCPKNFPARIFKRFAKACDRPSRAEAPKAWGPCRIPWPEKPVPRKSAAIIRRMRGLRGLDRIKIQPLPLWCFWRREGRVHVLPCRWRPRCFDGGFQTVTRLQNNAEEGDRRLTTTKGEYRRRAIS